MSRPPPPLPFPIPNSILLFIHLHLLHYPLEDAECDADLFNSTVRGIGERIKSMEHIVYFLTGCIEGAQQVKKLLPMYPCEQPGDIVSFRNAVIKYLETTRTTALKPQQKQAKGQPAGQPMRSSRAARSDPNKVSTGESRRNAPVKPSIPFARPGSALRLVSGTSTTTATTSVTGTVRSTSTTSFVSTMTSNSNSSRAVSSAPSTTRRSTPQPPSKSGTKASNAPSSSSSSQTYLPEPYGWWWRDVPVRKSLLEECTGERFERMLLALSIHALFISQRDQKSLDIDIFDGLDVSSNLALFNTLAEQPDEYHEAKQRVNALHIYATQQEGELSQRRLEVMNMKEALVSSVNFNSQYPDDKDRIEELGTKKVTLVAAVEEIIRTIDGTESNQHEKQDRPIITDRILSFLFQTAGLQNHENDSNENEPTEAIEGKRLPAAGRKSKRHTRRTILPAAPLPTAAAHHFTNLNSLAKLNDFTIEPSESKETNQQEADAPSNPADALSNSLLQQLNDSEINFTNALMRFRKELKITHVTTQEEFRRIQAGLDEPKQISEMDGTNGPTVDDDTEEANEITNREKIAGEESETLQSRNSAPVSGPKLDLHTHSDDLQLNLEFPKTVPTLDSLPLCLQRDLTFKFIDASNAIREAITTSIVSVQNEMQAHGDLFEDSDEAEDTAGENDLDTAELSEEEDDPGGDNANEPVIGQADGPRGLGITGQASVSRLPVYHAHPTPKRKAESVATPKPSTVSRTRSLKTPQFGGSPEKTPKVIGTVSRAQTRSRNLLGDTGDDGDDFWKTPSKSQSISRSQWQSQSKSRAQTGQKTPPRPSYEIGATPSMNMSMFVTPSKNLENIRDILPPFQSPWRSVTRIQHSTHKSKSPRKSMGRPRLSGVRPRLSRGFGNGVGDKPSTGFIRTPLKSGKRLSNIIAPVQFHLSSARKSNVGPNGPGAGHGLGIGVGLGTPRASLDDVYEEIIDSLVKDVSMRTPPSMSGSRLLGHGNSIQRSSPFKSLMASGRGPRTPQSPEVKTNTDSELADLDELNEPSFVNMNLNLQEQGQEQELDPFSTADADEDSDEDADEWEDVLNMEEADGMSTVRRGTSNMRMSMGALTKTPTRKSMGAATPKAGLGPRMSEEYYEGPSLTLQDMLLRAGREGIQGANGTFNFNLLHNNELDDGDDDGSLYL